MSRPGPAIGDRAPPGGRWPGARVAALHPRTQEVGVGPPRHAGHEGARDGRGHFNVEVVSPAFEGLGPLARHRAVYAALDAMMATDIHALSIRAMTPEDAAKANG